MVQIKVMLIEDDFYSRYALYSILSTDNRIFVIDDVVDVEEAIWVLKGAKAHQIPNVIVFDVDLFAEASGSLTFEQSIRAIRVLQEAVQPLKCRTVCCAMSPNLFLVREAVTLGVDAILKKNEVAYAICDVVVKVHEGYFVYTQGVSQVAFGRLEGIKHEKVYLVPAREALPLTRDQRRIARLYCEDGMSAKEIAERLRLTEAGIRSHIRNILRALKVRNRAEARERLVHGAYKGR